MARATECEEIRINDIQATRLASGRGNGNVGSDCDWPESENNAVCWGNIVEHTNPGDWPSSSAAPAPEAAITRGDVTRIHDRLLDLEEMAENKGSASVIRDDVKNLQGRLRGLEVRLSNLQLNAARSAQTQLGTFATTFPGSAQPHIPQGWGPSIPLQQGSGYQPVFVHQGVDETKGSEHQDWGGAQGGRPKPKWGPSRGVIDRDDRDYDAWSRVVETT